MLALFNLDDLFDMLIEIPLSTKGDLFGQGSDQNYHALGQTSLGQLGRFLTSATLVAIVDGLGASTATRDREGDRSSYTTSSTIGIELL